MGELVEVGLSSGDTMWVTLESGQEARDVGFGEKFTNLPGLAAIVEWVSSGVSAGLTRARPGTVTAEFGVEIAAGEHGLVAALAGVGGKATVKVSMTWGGPDAGPAAEAG
ncbi:CU044_2847 family protein [Actinoplanes sp. NPDC051851]|uniref:CU044_2847 family protein n=1 Tax=Actinoplanes sp. NPDC051851 TaxID=3154753 RepID=UPI00344809D9